MSNARKVRRSIAWARYTNHYAFMLDVSVGGWSFIRTGLNVPGGHWRYVRRQAKRRFSA